MEENHTRKEITHKDSNNTHTIWGVALKTPTATTILVATIMFLVTSAAAIAFCIFFLPKNWPLLSSFLAINACSFFASVYDIMHGWKNNCLYLVGAGLIGALAYVIVTAILTGFAH